jgi:hypothetical protein
MRPDWRLFLRRFKSCGVVWRLLVFCVAWILEVGRIETARAVTALLRRR